MQASYSLKQELKSKNQKV